MADNKTANLGCAPLLLSAVCVSILTGLGMWVHTGGDTMAAAEAASISGLVCIAIPFFIFIGAMVLVFFGTLLSNSNNRYDNY